LDKLQEDLLI